MDKTEQYYQAELSLYLTMIEDAQKWYREEKHQLANLQRAYVCMTLERLVVWPLIRVGTMWAIVFGASASRYVDHHAAYNSFVYQIEAVNHRIKQKERDLLEFKKRFTQLVKTATDLQIQRQSASQQRC